MQENELLKKKSVPGDVGQSVTLPGCPLLHPEQPLVATHMAMDYYSVACSLQLSSASKQWYDLGHFLLRFHHSLTNSIGKMKFQI